MPLSERRIWTVVGLLALGMGVAFVDRATLSVALASQDFRAFFGLTDLQRGWLNSAFFWSYALLQIPAGLLVDRWGVKKTYAVSYLLWGMVAAATSLAPSLLVLLALRILLGVGEAVVTPASLRWITHHLPEQKRGLAIGLLFAGAKLGPALGAGMAALLVESYGWRWMFAIIGLGGLLWLLPWMKLATETPRVTASSSAPRTTWKELLTNPIIAGVLIGTFAYNYFQYFCLTWMPAYFAEHRHLSLGRSGLFTTFSFLGMAVVAIAAGQVADRLIRAGRDAARVRRGFTIAGFAVASLQLAGVWVESEPLALGLSIASLSGLGLATANYWALTQTLIPNAGAGRLAGLQNTASNLSGIVAPALTGWLKQETGGYGAPVVAVAAVLAAGLLAYALLVKPSTNGTPIPGTGAR